MGLSRRTLRYGVRSAVACGERFAAALLRKISGRFHVEKPAQQSAGCGSQNFGFVDAGFAFQFVATGTSGSPFGLCL